MGGKFGTILADPAWQFQQWGQSYDGRGAEEHYSTMRLEDICSLPVREVALKDSVLLLWTTVTHLEQGFAVMTAWGWKYQSCALWIKMTRATAPRVGLGFHLRNAAEFLLIGTRGKPKCPPRGTQQIGVIFNPIGSHSRKPDAQYRIAEQYDGPYLELFARPHGGGLVVPTLREGWVQIGNEVTGRDIRDDLRRLIAGEEEEDDGRRGDGGEGVAG